MEDKFIALCQQIRQSADYMRQSKCLSRFDTEKIVTSALELKEKVMISLTAGQNVDILLKEGNENSGRYPRGSGDDQEVEGPNGSKITKKHNPNDYSNVKCGSSGNTERTETGRMTDNRRKKDHINRHAKDLGIKPSDYEKEGVEFLSKPLGKNMEEMTLKDGRRYRYDYKTERFAVANRDNNMATFYFLSANEWESKINLDGRKE